MPAQRASLKLRYFSQFSKFHRELPAQRASEDLSFENSWSQVLSALAPFALGTPGEKGRG